MSHLGLLGKSFALAALFTSKLNNLARKMLVDVGEKAKRVEVSLMSLRGPHVTVTTLM